MDRRYSPHEIDTIAAELLRKVTPREEGATVVGLQGDLGAGKTTLTQALARLLNIEDTVVSPTFVIAKFYSPTDPSVWRELVHIDAYRIENVDELVPLGWQQLLASPRTLIVVEWPEKISTALPPDTKYFAITHEESDRYIKAI